VAWDDLDRVAPADFTVHADVRLLDADDPSADHGRRSRCAPIRSRSAARSPVARVQAMPEGNRRARRQKWIRSVSGAALNRTSRP
jgi:hypothetical protein